MTLIWNVQRGCEVCVGTNGSRWDTALKSPIYLAACATEHHPHSLESNLINLKSGSIQWIRENKTALCFNSADVFVKIHACVCRSKKHINHSLPWNAQANGVLEEKTKRSIETTRTTDVVGAFNKNSRTEYNYGARKYLRYFTQQTTDTGKGQRSTVYYTSYTFNIYIDFHKICFGENST